MANNNFRISYFIVILILGILSFCLGFTNHNYNEPNLVYNVYLDGKIIGTIRDKDSFEEYINAKEEDVKKKYKVDKVYMPNGVSIKKVYTYSNNIDSNDVIYNKLVNLKQFTIKGIVITLSNKKDKNYKNKYIYTLNKDIFDKALESLVKSFVDDEEYDNYINSTQKQIVDTGSVIKNIDIIQSVTYKTSYISINKDIYTSSVELAKYLLYGTTEEQASYIVKEGDTVESVALANKLNVQEFLIANSNALSIANICPVTGVPLL